MRKRTSIALLGALLAAALVVAGTTGCGSKKKSTTTNAAGQVTPPANIKAAGQISFCSDMTYPPEEFIQNGKPVGADIDIGQAIANLMGVQAKFTNTGFDAIIPALLSSKCDAIISSLTNTAERAKQVDFVNYIQAGMSLLVAKGNPKGITDLNSLSGKRVAVQVSTTEKDALDKLNETLASQGKAKIDVRIFKADTDAAVALATGRVDAYFTDSPPASWHLKQSPDKFEQAGAQINAAPIGIAFRKDEADLSAAVAKTIPILYSNGTMKTILEKWKMASFVLPGETLK
jgi:polar amino acid transport system substrate-binding protein